MEPSKPITTEEVRRMEDILSTLKTCYNNYVNPKTAKEPLIAFMAQQGSLTAAAVVDQFEDIFIKFSDVETAIESVEVLAAAIEMLVGFCGELAEKAADEMHTLYTSQRLRRPDQHAFQANLAKVRKNLERVSSMLVRQVMPKFRFFEVKSTLDKSDVVVPTAKDLLASEIQKAVRLFANYPELPQDLDEWQMMTEDDQLLRHMLTKIYNALNRDLQPNANILNLARKVCQQKRNKKSVSETNNEGFLESDNPSPEFLLSEWDKLESKPEIDDEDSITADRIENIKKRIKRLQNLMNLASKSTNVKSREILNKLQVSKRLLEEQLQKQQNLLEEYHD
jgi:hypothetical protein